ncbi:MAG: hypothetical protein SGARI_004146 [Bacillariaceae sp.]
MCFAAICKEDECCGFGSRLATDPSREEPSCYCTTACTGFCKPGKNVAACEPGEDGEKIADPGKLDISGADCIFIADKDISADQKQDIKDEAPGVDKLEDKEKPVGDIVIMGHGADGGVRTSGTDIDGENITDAQAQKIKDCLGTDSKIIFISCAQADEEDNDNMQRLADKTMRTVVGNVKAVTADTDGDGDWLEFDPEMPAPQ